VAVSQATATRLAALGLPAGSTVALANFVAQGGFAERSRADRGSHALVAGRLVEEKGFDTAIVAARAAGVPLIVAGDGPDRERLQQLAAGGDVRFTGRLAPEALAELRRGAGTVLAPSRWEEPCPYSVLDAMAAGVPALVSDRGGLPELADDQGVLPAQEPAAWSAALARLWRDPEERLTRGELALARARELHNEDRYYERLIELYDRVITASPRGGRWRRSD
jgi:glycosyltransferase involved in cell wall biosynthesis